jgi:tripeptide aminopeptidase
MKDNVVNRFLWYVKFDTQSDPNSGTTPSTAGQMVFARELVEELKKMDLKDIDLDANGYLMATLPSNIDEQVPVVGFIAHMDTSPDFTGYGVSPQVVKSYKGGDIVLDEKKDIILSATIFPELEKYKGQDLIVTNGHTLLGADDKAGVAEIMTAIEYLVSHPEIKHGKIRIAFTPDEEIGQGADHFDIHKFGADFAYTLDGGEIGSLEFENFNAAGAKVIIHGSSVHPGYAKNKLKNSIKIAYRYISLLPEKETPENTQEYEGFYHLTDIKGDVEQSEIDFIIRDFDAGKFEERKDVMRKAVHKINMEYGSGTAEVVIKDQYFNMQKIIDKSMFVIDIAKEAIQSAGMEARIVPIRGGTDGARLTYMGLPCPNIFAGGHNFHGKFEYIPTSSMEKACQVLIQIAHLVAQKELVMVNANER